jgi:hypothetical protein
LSVGYGEVHCQGDRGEALACQAEHDLGWEVVDGAVDRREHFRWELEDG